MISVMPKIHVYVHSCHPLVLCNIERLLASANWVRPFSRAEVHHSKDFNWILILDTYSVEKWLEIAIECSVNRKRPIIILADSLQTAEEELRLIYLGVRGIVPIWNLEGDLERAVESVIEGGLWVRRRTLDLHLMRTKLSAAFVDTRLTIREEQIITLVIKRLSNKEIANMLRISERTVKFHVSSIFRKVGLRNRRDLLKSRRPAAELCEQPPRKAIGSEPDISQEYASGT